MLLSGWSLAWFTAFHDTPLVCPYALCHTDGGFNCHRRINSFSAALNINLKSRHWNRWKGRLARNPVEPVATAALTWYLWHKQHLWHNVFRRAGFGVEEGGWVGRVGSRWLLFEKNCCLCFLLGPCVMTVCLHHRCDLRHQGEESMEAEHAASFPLTYKPTLKVFSQVWC